MSGWNKTWFEECIIDKLGSLKEYFIIGCFQLYQHLVPG